MPRQHSLPKPEGNMRKQPENILRKSRGRIETRYTVPNSFPVLPDTRSPRRRISHFLAIIFGFVKSFITVALAELSGFNLPDQFQRKLNLARGGLCGRDEPRTGNGVPALVENRKVVGRRGKIRAVENVDPP
jgi:hypothetical protein